MALAGCGLLRVPVSQQHKPGIKSLQVQTATSPRTVTADQIQSQVMRFADVYTVQVAEAADNLAPKLKHLERAWRRCAGNWDKPPRLTLTLRGPNPYLNALDMLVLVTLSRMVVEDYGVHTFGDDAVPILEKQRQLETNAWSLASGLLKPVQQQELKI